MIVDYEPVGGGAPITIFESGAIMMYLGEKTRKFWPQEPHLKYEVCQWILWQAGNQGPKFGEQGFLRYGRGTALCSGGGKGGTAVSLLRISKPG